MSIFKTSKKPKVIEHDPNEFFPNIPRMNDLMAQTSVPKIQPLVRGCPVLLEKKFRLFGPRYRDGLASFDTVLIAIEWHDASANFVALYQGRPSAGWMKAAWAWIDGKMVELDQEGPTETIYPIDLHWLESVGH